MFSLHRIYTHITLLRPQSFGLPHDGGSELRCLHHDWRVQRLLPVHPHAVATATFLSCRETYYSFRTTRNPPALIELEKAAATQLVI